MNSSRNKDWLEAQRLYMEVLNSFCTTAVPEQTTGTQLPKWEKALEHWWQTALPGIPAESQAIFSNLLQQSLSWHVITEQFNKLIQTIADSDEKTSNWQTLLAEHIDIMKSQLQAGLKSTGDVNWQGGMQSPLESWQTMISKLSSATDSTTPGFQFDNLQSSLERYYSLPGLGQNRQVHEQVREGLRLWQAYQDDYQAYQQLLVKVELSSLDNLHEKFLALASQQQAITSLSNIYDLWVDSHEEAYAEYVRTEEYSQRYGKVVNSMLAFRKHGKQFVSEMVKALNLPTQAHLDTLQQQQVELRQQLQDLKKLQETDRKKVKVLEERIRQLKTAKSPQSGCSGSGQKQAAKRKVIRKTVKNNIGKSNK